MGDGPLGRGLFSCPNYLGALTFFFPRPKLQARTLLRSAAAKAGQARIQAASAACRGASFVGALPADRQRRTGRKIPAAAGR